MREGLSPSSVNKVLGVLGLGVLALAICFVVIVGSRVFLLFFGAFLFAIFLRRLGELIQRWIHVSQRWGVLLVICLLIVAAGVLATTFAVNITQQFDTLGALVEDAYQDLRGKLRDSRWIDLSGEGMPSIDSVLSGGASALGGVTKALSTTASVVIGFLIIFVVGIFFAVDGRRYRRGVVLLIPPPHRERAGRILDRIVNDLWLWLGARMISMAIIGVLTTVVLLILGIPMPVTLGFIAAILTFIPNIGAVVAIVLPALLALEQGMGTVIAVIAAYTGIQMIESYGITPLIQQRIAKLPGALLIFSQILAGILFGFLGIALASPLALIAMILVEELYVNPMSEKMGATDAA
ncbi:MAG: AI-2E family transporter [Candidatus Eisenbacteria bacterium]|nr:AI-2E family transporter [Candidatus Latescibacterota bacterium]MBD3302282.1 AI-2E family transporter [Candidatus Eisenbacteria bacterium]